MDGLQILLGGLVLAGRPEWARSNTRVVSLDPLLYVHRDMQLLALLPGV